ncbi:MAG: hypothetical protein EOM26_05980 [Alphaproteobacteria bacterium]|nr:hypothetical protein [Alphaproteobacteria bacterium]
MKKLNLTNLLFWMLGLIGFLIAVFTFIVIATGIDTSGDQVRSGMILFVSFIMCAGVAFSGLIIMALTQISSVLHRIEKLMLEHVERTR